MKLWYWTREFSESESFPETHIFGSEEKARETMVAEAIELQRIIGPDSWITESLDGKAITYTLATPGGHLARTINTINVQRVGGRTDCFILQSQEVTL